MGCRRKFDPWDPLDWAKWIGLLCLVPVFALLLWYLVLQWFVIGRFPT